MSASDEFGTTVTQNQLGVRVAASGANPDAAVPYVFGSEIARGGMGSILQAEDCKLSRAVAVKIILSDLDVDEGKRQRFVNEAGVLARLAHPNIVPVYDIGRDAEGQLFYSMKLVKGRTLKAILKDISDEVNDEVKHYTLARLLMIFRKVCDAMAFAHSKGFIHRDLKPENVMVGEFGEVLVMDWGLAKLLSDPDDALPTNFAVGAGLSPSISRHVVSGGGMTLDGSVMGTPQYMSPEQAEGRISDMDARSDIFSLGGILYTILTLRPPVEGKTLQEVLQKVSSGGITPPSAFGEGTTGKGKPSVKGEVLEARMIKPLPHCPGGRVPAALSAVAMQALALQREKRYQSVDELQRDIEAYQTGFATRAEHAGLAKQLLLLIKRHKGVFGTAAAAWLIITALAVWFVINLRVSEQKATRNAEIAQENERRAEANEQQAIAEKENVRRALAKSALAPAEAAYREANGPVMQAALDDVPPDLRDSNWSYLLEQSDHSIARISTGSDTIWGVAAHPKLPGVFAVADSRHKVTLFKACTGERLLQFDFDFGKASSRAGLHVAFSSDGDRIAVGKDGGDLNDPGGGIAVYSARDGSKLLAWDSTPVGRLEFSPDGRHLLQGNSGDKNSHLNLWDATSGKLKWTYKPANGWTRGVITPDGGMVLAGWSRGKVLALKLEDGSESSSLNKNLNDINSLAVHPDGIEVLWGDVGGYVHAFDFRDGRLLFSKRVHASRVRQIAFTPDGERFVSLAELPDGRQSIQLSNARTGELLQSLIGGSGSVRTSAVHPVSGELLIGGQNCRLWNIAGAPSRWVFRCQGIGAYSLCGTAFLGSDNNFLGPTKTYRTALLDLRKGSDLWKPTDANYFMPTTSTDGRFVAFGKLGLGSVGIQVVRRESETFEVIGEFSATGNDAILRMSPTGDRLALAINNGRRLDLLNPATGARLVALERGSLPDMKDLQWVGTGEKLVGLATAKKRRGVEMSEERIVVWDAATGQELRHVVYPTPLDCLVISSNGRSIAAAGADKLVHIFDTETLAERQTFRAHDGPITSLAWHPSRPILATGSEDLTIKLWNLETGRRLEILRGPTGTPRVLNFSPSGQRLACASADRTVRIWEPKWLDNAVLNASKNDGWEDLLAPLKADDVRASGNGWTLRNGVLLSPAKAHATLPLGGSFARSSYRVRVTLRKLNPRGGMAVILPVGDQQVGFYLDFGNADGSFTTLALVNGKLAADVPGSAQGRQVRDSETHDLEISVQVSLRSAKIVAALDERPFYDWSGPTSVLALNKQWGPIPQSDIALGAVSAGWTVSAVKVMRLDGN